MNRRPAATARTADRDARPHPGRHPRQSAAATPSPGWILALLSGSVQR